MKAVITGLRSTYRLQLCREFGFDQASAALAYLKELGVSHVYCSPVLRAGPESTHGYDVCSQQEIDPKLGGGDAFDRFLKGMRELGLGLLLDIVPNHMRAGVSNPWWRDVLENGRASRWSRHFDVDWDSEIPDLHDRVVLPILGRPHGEALEAGEIKLGFVDGQFWISCFEHRLPISKETRQAILDQVRASVSPSSPAIDELICHPPGEDRDQTASCLDDLYRSCEPFHSALDSYLTMVNGVPGDASSFDQLDGILKRQHYRLCWWRLAPEQINYRRFFDITDLICLNAQNAEVFEASHQLVRSLLARDIPLGLRVDHPDGLWDPREYFARLQDLVGSKPHYVVAEKILSDGEDLPRDWSVSGTTGYEFLNQLNGIFIDHRNESDLTEVYQSFTGIREDFDAILFRSRLKILLRSFRRQFELLAMQLIGLLSQDRHGRDLPVDTVREAFVAFIVAFPVYRSYVTEHSMRLSSQDRRAIKRAIRECQHPEVRPLFDAAPAQTQSGCQLIGRLLNLQIAVPGAGCVAADRIGNGLDTVALRHFLMKLQQLTAPLAAKGLEDTACYIYNRLISLNEVGGNPGVFGGSVAEFHRQNRHRFRRWPDSLLATSTHDTKRGEDARARIDVLSEMPDEWAAAVQRWAEANASAKTLCRRESAPSRNDEYLVYQSLIGAWSDDVPSALPVFRQRMIQYLRKAIREAKEHTSWVDQDPVYESAVANFVERILSGDPVNPFLPDFVAFQKRVSFFGYINSLAQVFLKIASPGVPDFYQGSEIWDFSLVDPDNRRPVDYRKRMDLFAALKDQSEETLRSPFLDQLLADAPSGAVKMFVAWQLLQFRRTQADLFARGRYLAATAKGPAARHVCAFTRRLGAQEILAVAPRLVFTLMAGREQWPLGKAPWSETGLHWPGARVGTQFTELFSGRRLVVESLPGGPGLSVREILGDFPVALLSR